MTPTLSGRIQTRLFLLATVGLGWTLAVAWLLPRGGGTIGGVYRATLSALLVVGLVGIVWELIYHGLQQYRWEKDWPILYGLLTGIPECIPVYLIIRALFDPPPPAFSFFFHFFTTWVVMWLVAVGPMRLVFLRWRFNGGQLL